MSIDENWWKLMEIDENWLKLMNIDENRWKLMGVDVNWWKCMKITGRNWWKLMDIDENLWKSMKMYGNYRPFESELSTPRPTREDEKIVAAQVWNKIKFILKIKLCVQEGSRFSWIKNW